MLHPVCHLYLFFDEPAPYPQLSEDPLPQGTALLMGIYEGREEAHRHLEAMGIRIDEALAMTVGPRRPQEAARSD